MIFMAKHLLSLVRKSCVSGQVGNLRTVDFETGPLGLEIEWSAPPATWLRQVPWLIGVRGCRAS